MDFVLNSVFKMMDFVLNLVFKIRKSYEEHIYSEKVVIFYMLCYIPKSTFFTLELHNLPMVTLFLTVPKQLHNAIQSKTIFFRKMTCRYVPTQFLCAETSLPLMIILGIFADMKISRFFRTDIIEKVLFLST